MSVFILDVGNSSIIKAKIANGETAFPRALQPLTEANIKRSFPRQVSTAIP